jgi:hypothetical protein
MLRGRKRAERSVWSISDVRDARIAYFVIPAKAGIHWISKVKMDPRLRGDDVMLAGMTGGFWYPPRFSVAFSKLRVANMQES